MRYLLAPILLAIASPVAAQSPAAPDPATVAAAKDLLEATGFNAQLEAGATQTASATLDTVLGEVEKKHGRIPDARRAEFAALMQRHVDRVVARIKPTALDEAAVIYARHFTADELDQLKALQTHPVVHKANAIMPQLMAELSQIGAAESFNALEELQADIAALVATWDD